MGKLGVVVFILWSLVMCMAVTRAYAKAQDQDSLRFQNLCLGMERTTQIQLYVQDQLTGPNATVWEVARSNISNTPPGFFGLVRVVDDVLTAQPDRNSEPVGRIQGFITNSDLQQQALTMNLNFVFTSGEYNGSTLCMLGRNPLENEYRELAIVGGTGLFRMARGYAITNTVFYTDDTSYGVLEYNLYVAYVESGSSIAKLR